MGERGGGLGGGTSPRRCCILKVRELIFSWGELGKQKKQFVREDMRSIIICDIVPTRVDCRCWSPAGIWDEARQLGGWRWQDAERPSCNWRWVLSILHWFVKSDP